MTGLAWTDPLVAHRKLRAAGTPSILLLGAGAHPDARWSFLATTFAGEIRVEGDTVHETLSGATTTLHGAVMAHLRRAVAAAQGLGVPGVPFSGGWVGLVGYEFGRLLEPTLPPPKAPPPTPDLLLYLALDVLAFDHHEKRVVLCSRDLAGAEPAETRARRIMTRMGQPVSPPAPYPPEAATWSTSLDEAAFCAAVGRLKERIADGDLFQANLATRFTAPFAGDPADLLEGLRSSNPSPFMGLLEVPGFSIVSGSPELLVQRHGDIVRSRPIAGTRKRGRDDAEDAAMELELRGDEKERAEHTMLVDLVRNDLAKVAVPGTVHVPERMSVERYRHVMHLASRVEAQARAGTSSLDALAALFPGGTITGAPKHRSMLRIWEEEPVPRGAYTGALGYFDVGGGCAWNILIRTAVVTGGQIQVHAGSGIVADSEPGREWKEAGRKAQALLDAATGRTASGGTRLGEVVASASWRPARPPRHVAARVLLIDNYDSFVHNLADYCAALGAAVLVVRNDEDWRAAVADFAPTHVILSPGPGWPKEAGSTMDVARRLHGRLPMLGVCLGHQALGEAHGGRVVRHPAGAVHGKVAEVHHEGAGLFSGLASPLQATRYHSLIVDAAGMHEWVVDARLSDGTAMALRHRTAPTFGLQFHPESLCTDAGLELIARFLETHR